MVAACRRSRHQCRRWRWAAPPGYHRGLPRRQPGGPREPLRDQPPHPGAHVASIGRPRGRRPADDQSPGTRIRRDARADHQRSQAVLRDRERHPAAELRRHRRPRGGDRQHALTGRQGPRREHRRVRRSVRQDRQGIRRGRHEGRRRMGSCGGSGCRPRRASGGRHMESRPPDPQRDLDRGDEPGRGARSRDPSGGAERADPGR